MTGWEAAAYAARYRIAPQRLAHIAFYWFDDRVLADPVPAEQRSIIMSSGRNSCDWPTLIAALGDRDDLVIVCSAADLPTVTALAGQQCHVRSDIPRAEHDELLATRRLLVLALQDNDRSAGHVRLLGAATLGTPVVATAVKGIEGTTSWPPRWCRRRIRPPYGRRCDHLLADTEALAVQAQAIRELAQDPHPQDYLADIKILLPAGLTSVQLDAVIAESSEPSPTTWAARRCRRHAVPGGKENPEVAIGSNIRS